MNPQDEVTDLVSVDPSVFVSKARPALFVMSRGGQFGKRYPLEEASVSLGRAGACAIQIDQQGVSRRHCTLTTETSGAVRLEDAGSSNGTLLNGRWLSSGESVQLQDGDHIWCGGILLRFVAEGNCDHSFLEELLRRACFDSLTGLFNRGHFEILGEAELQRARRHDHFLSLLLLDFDLFKQLNDRFGHLCGDYVLQETAELMQQSVRREDIIGRWGGEEFAILLPETHLLGASIAAHVLRTTIENHSYRYRGSPIKVTISLGVASLGEQQHGLADLFESGDEQLLRAKRSGRNRVCVAEPSSPRHVSALSGWRLESTLAVGGLQPTEQTVR